MFPEADRVRKLLVRGTNWVGDAVLTTPALDMLRRNFPEARIHLLVVSWVADLFSADPRVDRLVVYRREDVHKGLQGKIRLAGYLRTERYDAAVLLQNAFEAALIAWLARIPHRAGYATDLRGPLLTHAVPLQSEDKRVHQSRYYVRMLERLGLRTDAVRLGIHVGKEARERVDRMLTGRKTSDQEKVVIVAPGASYGSAKTWPVAYYGELVRRIRSEWNPLIVLLGSAGERDMCRAIAGRSDGRILNLSGEIALSESVGWIHRADLVVSNDSGLMHVAAALQIPQVAIFGPTNEDSTGPANPRARVVNLHASCAPCMKKRCPSDHRCMLGVSPEDVFREAAFLAETYWK